jgi:hypothetical protein
MGKWGIVIIINCNLNKANQNAEPSNAEIFLLVFFILPIEECGQKAFNQENVAKGITEDCEK